MKSLQKINKIALDVHVDWENQREYATENNVAVCHDTKIVTYIHHPLKYLDATTETSNVRKHLTLKVWDFMHPH